MPTVEQNKTHWASGGNWHNRGDDWSGPWGDPFMQWCGSLYPRVKAHLPAAGILEIACGYGRWTEYLKDECDRLVALDLSEECVEVCKRRFSGSANIEYHVNDGKSLDMIPDGSVDFIFSFDSLVHATESVLEAYLSQFPRILGPNGAAFIHHSNLGQYSGLYAAVRRVPKLEGSLTLAGILDDCLHWRDPSVCARTVESMARRHGLRCISQEIVKWRTDRLYIDCMSTIVRSDSAYREANKVFRNPHFMAEAANLCRLAPLYSPGKIAKPAGAL